MHVPEVAEVVLFAGTHPRLVFSIRDVVVAAKVENTVGQEMGDLGVERMADCLSLALGGGKGDGNIPEQLLIGHALDEIIGFVRKRKDIRRLIDAEELEVHLADFFVICDKDGKRRAFFDAFAGHHAAGERLQGLNVDGWRLDDDFNGDVVRNGGSYFAAKMWAASLAAVISGMGRIPKTKTPSVVTPSDSRIEGLVFIGRASPESPRNICRATER